MGKKAQSSEQRQCWIFQAKPEEYNLNKFIIPGNTVKWRIKNHFNDIKPGDIVLFWQAGQDRGIYGWGEIIDPPYLDEKEALEKGGKPLYRAPAVYRIKFQNPLPAGIMKKQDALQNMSILKMAIGSSFSVTIDQEGALHALLEESGEKVWEFPPPQNGEQLSDDAGPNIGNIPVISDQVEGVIGVDEVAEVLSNILLKLKPTEKARMVGIFGRWGRGKTFLYNKVAGILGDGDPYIHVKFHAWKYQDTPAYWAYLYEVIANKYFNKPSCSFCFCQWLDFWYRIIRLNLTRYGWAPIINLALILSYQVIIGLISYQMVEEKMISAFQGVFGGISLSLTSLVIFSSALKKQYSVQAKDVLNKYTRKISFKQHLGVQAEIQKEIKNLLRTWFNQNEAKHQKILLFVDDIDRCSDDKILTLIDALRVMVEDEEISQRITILTAADERVVIRAIIKKYYDLVSKEIITDNKKKSEILNNLAKEYMDKLFLSGIKLGELTSNERIEVYEAFVKDKIRLKNTAGQANEPSKEVLIKTDPGGDGPVNDPETDPDTGSEKGEASSQKEFELTEDENTYLKAILQKHKYANPRSIRIFYYRYLLAKHLLLKDGIGGSETTKWADFPKKEILPNILLHYSLGDNIGNLVNDRREINNNTEDPYNYTVLETKYNIDKNLLIKILCIVEMVVPY